MRRSSLPIDPALLAIVCVGLFVGLLGLLHVIRADLDPSWHFISEYEIGRHGWLMQGAFLLLALANLALLVAVWPALRGVVGTLGAVLFLVGTLGTVLGGLAVPDAAGTLPEAATASGKLHSLGGGLGLAGVLGTWLMSAALASSDAWRPERKALLAATALFTLGFLVAFVSIATLTARSGGTFGPDVPVGWPNRIGILAGCAWILTVARAARCLARARSEIVTAP